MAHYDGFDSEFDQSNLGGTLRSNLSRVLAHFGIDQRNVTPDLLRRLGIIHDYKHVQGSARARYLSSTPGLVGTPSDILLLMRAVASRIEPASAFAGSFSLFPPVAGDRQAPSRHVQGLSHITFQQFRNNDLPRSLRSVYLSYDFSNFSTFLVGFRHAFAGVNRVSGNDQVLGAGYGDGLSIKTLLEDQETPIAFFWSPGVGSPDREQAERYETFVGLTSEGETFQLTLFEGLTFTRTTNHCTFRALNNLTSGLFKEFSGAMMLQDHFYCPGVSRWINYWVQMRQRVGFPEINITANTNGPLSEAEIRHLYHLTFLWASHIANHGTGTLSERCMKFVQEYRPIEFAHLNSHVDPGVLKRFKAETVHILAIKNRHMSLVTAVDFLGRLDEQPVKDQVAMQRFYNRRNGTLFYDFETRWYAADDEKGNPTRKFLRDVICHVKYSVNHGKRNTTGQVHFTTQRIRRSVTAPDGSVSEVEEYYTSARQFLDWLRERDDNFICYAHNGSGFDVYFLLAAMDNSELDHYVNQQKFNSICRVGFSIISLNYAGHVFRDTYKFLTGSLSSICEAFLPDKPDLWKQTNVSFFDPFSNKEIALTTTQLCFYQPDADFDAFLDLLDDPRFHEFTEAYNAYCAQDVVALFEVWTRYNTAVNLMLDGLQAAVPATRRDGLMSKGRLAQAITMGNHHMTILSKMNNGNNCWSALEDGCTKDADMCTFLDTHKLGGMSISAQKGLFLEPVTVYDVKSLYPTSLAYGLYPGGKPFWLTGTDYLGWDCPGLYELKDLEFEQLDDKWIVDGNLTYRGILEKDSDTHKKLVTQLFLTPDERTWLSFADKITSTTATTLMIEYLIKFHGLKKFTVVKGLIWPRWIHGASIFGTYLSTVYDIKRQQDIKKSAKDPAYNPGLREAVKLGMNSVTGKLGQSNRNRKGLRFSVMPEGVEMKDVPVLEDIIEDGSKADMTPSLVFLYEHSKIQMMQFWSCLPRGFQDLIAVETDSLHIKDRVSAEFEQTINTRHQSPESYHFRVPNHTIATLCLPARTETDFAVVDFDQKNVLFRPNSTIDLTPTSYCDAKSQDLGILVREETFERSVYITKKKYAGFHRGKWKMKMSAFRLYNTENDGSKVQALFPADYLNSVYLSARFENDVGASYETYLKLRTSEDYAITQEVTSLEKNLRYRSIEQVKQSKSVFASMFAGRVYKEDAYHIMTEEEFEEYRQYF